MKFKFAATLLIIALSIQSLLGQNVPSKKQLAAWESQVNHYKTSDSSLFNLYLDSIKTQLLDKTDTAHFWTGKYHMMRASPSWKNADVDWLRENYKIALAAFLMTGNQYYIALATDRLGRAYVHERQYDSARTYLFEAYQIAQGTESYALKKDILGSLSMLYFYSEDYEQALQYMKEFLSSVIANNDSTQFAGAFNNLAAAYYRLEKYDSSMIYHRESLKLALASNSQIDIAFSYLNFGEIYAELGVFDSAILYSQKSESIFKSLNYPYGIAATTLNLGKAYIGINRPKDALESLAQSLESSRKNKDPAHVRDVLDIMIIANQQLGDFEGAFNSLSERVTIKDSLDRIVKRQELDELITKYESEKKEQQIKLQRVQLSEKEAQLNQNKYLIVTLIIFVISIIAVSMLNRNRLKKKQQLTLQQEHLKSREAEIKAAITSQEKERTRYARDLHDGFGQMISILNMNLGSLKKDTNPDGRQTVFEASEKVINDMYGELKRICFDMMPQTLVQSGLQSGLEEFASRVNLSGKIAVETNFFGLEKRLVDIQEISLYRISQEWVNNVLKYSDADKITIQITGDEEEITLLIEDNGTGFDKSLLENSNGNGWKNLHSRAKLIQGTIELETEAGVKGNTLIVNAAANRKQEHINSMAEV